MKCVNKYPSSGCRHGISVTGEKCCIRELSCSRQMRVDLKRFVFFQYMYDCHQGKANLKVVMGGFKF